MLSAEPVTASPLVSCASSAWSFSSSSRWRRCYAAWVAISNFSRIGV